MKLLNRPSSTTDRITIGGSRTEVHTSINPLGLLGVGPLFKSHEVTTHSPVMHFAGRTKMNPVTIDFEGDDPWRICAYYDSDFDCWRRVQRPEGWDLEFDGVSYTLFGIFPLGRPLTGSIWKCTIDYYKE